MTEEKDYYKTNFSKIKLQLDDYRNKLKTSTEELSKLQKYLIEKKLEKKPINNVIINTNDHRLDNQLIESLKNERDRAELRLSETETKLGKANDQIRYPLCNKSKYTSRLSELESSLEEKIKALGEYEGQISHLRSRQRELELHNIDCNEEIENLKGQILEKNYEIDNLILEINETKSNRLV